MSLNIENPAAHALAHTVAKETGETILTSSPIDGGQPGFRDY